MSKIIMHIDMDAFFASCEEKNNPELRGKPVVVGANPKEGKGRGVVSTANYEARKYGIKSGMPISKAYKLNPKAVFLPVNFNLYSQVSNSIMKMLKNYSNKFQQISVDEAYLDVTEKVNDFDVLKNLIEIFGTQKIPKEFFSETKVLAQNIKNEIIEKESLTCSIGIASNKLIAKIASDFEKPNGLTIVKDDEIMDFLTPLSVRKLYGVGPKTEEKLKEVGIETIGQLVSFNREKLMEIFGVYGLYLSLSANGIGDDFVAEEYGRLSVGREVTFENDVDDFNFINEVIDEISNEIYKELKTECYIYKTVSIKIRLHDFKTFTRAKTLNYLSCDKKIISKIAKELSEEFIGNKIRLIGVRVSNLEEFKHQKTIKEFILT